MAIRKIVLEGDPCLAKNCRPVTEFNQRLWDLLDDMHETLTDAQGAGLAFKELRNGAFRLQRAEQSEIVVNRGICDAAR